MTHIAGDLKSARPPFARALAAFAKSLPPQARVGGAVILAFVAIALTVHWWAPYGSTEIMVGPPFLPPGAEHWFGTDMLGRDVFSRVMYGSRPVLVMAVSSALLAVVCGATIGLFAGYWRGWFDQLVMRVLDVLISIPTLIFAMLILTVAGNNFAFVILTVAFINMPRIARVIRAATLSIVEEDYVKAATLRGESNAYIVFVELMPNVLGTIFVELAVRSGFMIVFIGALGFLGLGAPPPTPEWGVMINEGRNTITASAWPVVAPAGAMAILVVALNLFTDGVARSIGADSTTRARL